MSLAELVIVSVTVEGRAKSRVAADLGLSRQWVHTLVSRYQREGQSAFQPRSRRPTSNLRAVGLETEDRIVRLRKELSRKGWGAGADTIGTHLLR